MTKESAAKAMSDIKNKELLKEVRQNQDLVNFVKSMTKEEMEQIKEQRKFNDIKTGTNEYKIAVLNHPVRSQLRNLKINLMRKLWTINDISNNLKRLDTQLTSGNITELQKDNQTKMNEAELRSFIEHNKWLRQGEMNALYPLLGELRSIVGFKDYAQKIILSMEEYDKVISEVQTKINEHGFDLFGEVR